MLIVKCFAGLEEMLSTGIYNAIQHKKYKISETSHPTLEISLPSKLLITSSQESAFLKILFLKYQIFEWFMLCFQSLFENT